MLNQVIQGDCLEVMATLPSHSIDLIATDLPYGTTQNKWDAVINPARMWQQFKRILKPSGAVVLTASQPFTTTLICSNSDWFRYSLVWEKQRPTGHLDCKRKPLKAHEDILVFYAKQPTYNPQGIIRLTRPVDNWRANKSGTNFNKASKKGVLQEFSNYPKSILKFDVDVHQKEHPTQKPTALMEYLIKTYSNPGDLVLDCTAGSGTTGIAAINTNRNFILIEKEQKYIDIIHKRLAEVQQQPRFEEMAG